MTSSRPQRFLVVEDELEILAEVTAYLRRRGQIVVAVSTYEQAVPALNDATPPIEVLITDARLPDGNGIDLIRMAIRLPEKPRTCILMTGHLDENDFAQDLRTAGVKIIFKPFSLSALTAVRLKREQIQLVADGDVIGAGMIG